MPGNVDFAPLYVRPGAIKAKMCQATPWPGAENTITVTLSSNVPLRIACDSAVVISNLEQACMQGVPDFVADGGTYPAACYSDGTLALNQVAITNGAATDASALQKFGNTGSWSYEYDAARLVHGGKLTLRVQADTEVDAEYVMSFNFRNPSFGQSSPPIRISATGIPISGTLSVKCQAFSDKAALNLCANKPLSCSVDDMDAEPLKVRPPEFLENQIGQSRPYPCVTNNILTVTLLANVVLPMNAAITLTNLDGIDLPSGYIDVELKTTSPSEATGSNQLLGPGDNAALYTAPAGSGIWDSELKKLTCKISGSAIPPFTRFIFHFTVKNPCCSRPSPPVCVKVSGISAPCNNCTAVGDCGTCVSIARQMLDRDFYTVFDSGSDGGYYGYSDEVYNKGTTITYGKANLGDAYPLLTYQPGFIAIQHAIGQSTPFPSSNNTITVTVATKTPLTVGSKLTLTGLSESATDSTSALSIKDAGTAEDPRTAVSVFGSTGEWNKQGSLLLTVQAESIAGVQYIFSFELMNPSCDLSARQVTVEATCCKTGACTYSMVLVPDQNKTETCHSQAGDARPLQVTKPTFVTHNIWQSNPFPCQNNSISIELDTNVDMLPTTQITVEGLTGSDTTSTLVLPVDVCGTRTVGKWDQASGKLVFQLISKQPACSTCIVKFDLKNPCCCQDSPISNVKISADVSCFGRVNAMVLPARNITLLDSSVTRAVAQELEPLHIRCPSWQETSIYQSSKYPCADNVITVSLSFNVPVPDGDIMSLVLSGIHDTLTLRSNLSVVGPHIKGKTGLFDPSIDSGTLVTQVEGRVEAYAGVVFNFTVINPRTPVQAKGVSLRIQGVLDTFMCTLVERTTVQQIPGDIIEVMVAELSVKDVVQSTPWPCAKNTITVSLSANVPLHANHVHCKPTITISGFESACVADKNVKLTGRNGSSVFNGNGTWIAEDGALIVSPHGEMLQEAIASFTFSLINPTDSQPSPLIEVEVSDIPIAKQKMVKDCTDGSVSKCLMLADSEEVGSTRGVVYEAGKRDAEPLRVHAPAFLTRNIGQNNSYPGQMNRISVTIRTNVDIPIGGLVTISVLNSACSSSGPIKLHDTDDSFNSSLGDELHFAHNLEGLGGTGMWDDDEKLLKLYVVKNMTAGTFYTFGFDVKNPQCAQSAQPVCIRAKGYCSSSSCKNNVLVIPRRRMVHDTSSLKMNCGVLYGHRAPLLVMKPNVTQATLNHTSAWASSDNQLTLTIQTNVPLSSTDSPRLILDLTTGHGSQTPSGQLDVIFGGVSTKAEWNSETGKLSVDIPIDTSACMPYNLIFTLRNRNCQNEVPATFVELTTRSVCSASGAGACFDKKQVTSLPLRTCSVSSYPLQVHGGSCGNGAAGTATFTAKKISQSSCLAGCNNTITVQLMANVPIPASSTQVIAIEFDMPSDVCVVQYGTLPWFAPTWSNKVLTLNVQQDLVACTLYNITFTITNDVESLRHSLPTSTSIHATGPVQIPKSSLEMPDDDCAKPFEVERPVFTVKKIGQSSPYPGATGLNANELCVTISTNTHMVVGSAFAIHGLHGAIARDGDMPLSGSSSALFASLNGTAGHGTWNNCEKVLSLNVVSDLDFCGAANHTFCFKVSNPVDAQLCAPVHINATKIATCKGEKRSIPVMSSARGTAMVGDETTDLSRTIPGAYAGDACPMVVWSAAFCVKEISQSSNLPCDENMITITLSTNVPLYPEVAYAVDGMATISTDITIRGLKGAIHPLPDSISIRAADGQSNVPQIQGSNGTWIMNQEDGTYNIIIKLAQVPSTPGGDGLVFSFKIQNPALQPPRTVPMVEAHGINIVQTRMREDVGVKQPMSISNTVLDLAQISQSTHMPCQTNTITVTMKGSKVVRACKGKITISGLLPDVHSASKIKIFDDNSTNTSITSYLNTTGSWSKSDENALLVLDMTSDFPADTLLSFSFHVTNPSQQTDANPVSISFGTTSSLIWSFQSQANTVGPGMLLPDQRMIMPARDNRRPITVTSANFLATNAPRVGNVFQSTPYPSKTNTITVSLQSSVPLNTKCDLIIILGPFNGACMSDNLASFDVKAGSLAVGDNTTVLREWNAKSGELRLTIKANGIPYTEGVSSQQLLWFSFNVKNPVNAQMSPNIFVKSLGITIPEVEVERNLLQVGPSDLQSGTPEDATPMYVRGLQIPNQFVDLNVGQHTAEPGASNIITVTISTNIPLPAHDPETKITISGLTGAKNFGGLVEASPNFNASWHEDMASIVLKTIADTNAGEKFTLGFKITNPVRQQVSPRVYIEASGIAIPPKAMNPDIKTKIQTVDDEGKDVDANPGYAAPLAVLKGKLYSRSVYQKLNSERPGSPNMLTISFKSTVALDSALGHVALVVTGLNGMRLSDGSRSGVPQINVIQGGEAVLVTNMSSCGGSPAEALQKCAQCAQAMRCPYLDGSTPNAPRLVVGINKIAANTLVEFTVTFMNAFEPQDCQTLSIETVSCDEFFDFLPAPLPVKKEFQGTYQCPLTITHSASFVIKKVCQSAACTGAVNTITVSLQPKFALTGAKNSEVTISGLRGSITHDSLVTLLAGAPVFESKARWVQSSGTLVLKVAAKATLHPQNITVVSFDLTNPRYSQPAVERVDVSATGDVPHESACMDQCEGLNAPMKVTPASFNRAAIHSSSSVGGSINTITITLQPHCTVLCESRNSVITLEGLVGSTTEDSPALPVTMEKGSAGLFMFSSDLTLSFSHTCALQDNKVLIRGVKADPTGTVLFFPDGSCAERYTKVTAFDMATGCATLDVKTGQWTDGRKACPLGTVSAVDVTQSGSGFQSGDFAVDSETGSGLTGKCVVSEGGVTSVVVTTPGEGYNHALKVRCPRACPIEQEQQVVACGCINCVINNTSNKKPGCGATVSDYGMYSNPVIHNKAKITSVCAWNRRSGRLTCTVQGCVKSHEETVFSVTLSNARINQPAQTVNVMASGQVSIPSVALSGNAMPIKEQGSVGNTQVQLTMFTSRTSWDGQTTAAVNDDGYTYLKAVAAAGGVDHSKVSINIREVLSVTAFARSSSYVKSVKSGSDKSRRLKMVVTVDVDDWTSPSFVASGLTSERINSKLKPLGAFVEIPEETRAKVVHTAFDSVTAVCTCNSSSLVALPQTNTTSTPGYNCSCTASISGIPALPNTTSYTLSTEVQCNGLARIRSMKAGTISIPSDMIAQPPETCNDQCDKYHHVLRQYDVTGAVMNNAIDVQITAEGLKQDYCGADDHFKALLVLAYYDGQ